MEVATSDHLQSENAQRSIRLITIVVLVLNVRRKVQSAVLRTNVLTEFRRVFIGSRGFERIFVREDDDRLYH